MPTVMPHTVASATSAQSPLLLLCATPTSGHARRMDGYIAHLLQRGGNHESLRYTMVNVVDRPDLAHRLEVTEVPSVVVIEDGHVVARAGGYQRPRALEALLAPWLH
jgi:thioredoxin-like negative regulator of GroEL